MSFDAFRVAHSVRAMNPISAGAGRTLASRAQDMMALANQADPRPASVARRNDLGARFAHVVATIDKAKCDPLPRRAGAVLKRAVLRAVMEYKAALSCAPEQPSVSDDEFEGM